MKKFTTYIIGNITVIESEEPETVEISVGNKSDMRKISRKDFNELCDLRYAVNFVQLPPPEPEILPEEIIEHTCACRA